MGEAWSRRRRRHISGSSRRWRPGCSSCKGGGGERREWRYFPAGLRREPCSRKVRRGRCGGDGRNGWSWVEGGEGVIHFVSRGFLVRLGFRWREGQRSRISQSGHWGPRAKQRRRPCQMSQWLKRVQCSRGTRRIISASI